MTLPAPLSGAPMIRHGGPGALVWRDDLAVPRPGPGEVLVRVLAVEGNAADIGARVGRSGAAVLPRGPGSDRFGRVVALGAGVTGLAPGATVVCPTDRPAPGDAAPPQHRAIGSDRGEAAAQYRVVPARHLKALPASSPAHAGAGAIPGGYGMAWNLVSRAQVAVGERVLVTGAAGGVGLATVHLAMLRGAEVTGHCPLGKAAALRAAGASVLGRDIMPEPRSFDVVIDVVGGTDWQARLRALRPGGRYATGGAVGGPLVAGDLRTIHLNDLTPFGGAHLPREVFAGLVTLITTARIRAVVSNLHPALDPAQVSARAPSDPDAGRCSGRLTLISSETDP